MAIFLFILGYFVILPTIIWGIFNEQKLIRFERAVVAGVKKTFEK